MSISPSLKAASESVRTEKEVRSARAEKAKSWLAAQIARLSAICAQEYPHNLASEEVYYTLLALQDHIGALETNSRAHDANALNRAICGEGE